MDVDSQEYSLVGEENSEDSEELILTCRDKRKKKDSKQSVLGVWTDMENLKYVQFLESNSELMSEELARRRKRVF